MKQLLFTWKPLDFNKFLPCSQCENIFRMYLHVPLKDRIGDVNVNLIMLLTIFAFYRVFRPSFLDPKKPSDHKVDLTSAAEGAPMTPAINFYNVKAHL